MSLILEALKKSEQQRRLGEAPTLGSPVQAVRRRRSLVPVIGALAVIALGAGWWLSRTPPDAPAPATPAPSAAASASKAAAPANGPVTAAGRKPQPHLTAPTSPPGVAPRPLAGGKPDAATRDPRTATAAAATGTPPKAAAPAAAATEPTKAPAAGTPPAAAAPAATPAPAPAPATPAATAAATPTPAAAPPAATPRAPAASSEASLPSVWELPYNTRKDIPELALTMHVYASDPSQRFVVIKGERHVEGDDLGDGLTLKEIRSDGMVLDYKGQRFVYPRGGG